VAIVDGGRLAPHGVCDGAHHARDLASMRAPEWVVFSGRIYVLPGWLVDFFCQGPLGEEPRRFPSALSC